MSASESSVKSAAQSFHCLVSARRQYWCLSTLICSRSANCSAVYMRFRLLKVIRDRRAKGRRETRKASNPVYHRTGDIGHIELVGHVLSPEHHATAATGKIEPGLNVDESVGRNFKQCRRAEHGVGHRAAIDLNPEESLHTIGHGVAVAYVAGQLPGRGVGYAAA